MWTYQVTEDSRVIIMKNGIIVSETAQHDNHEYAVHWAKEYTDYLNLIGAESLSRD
jgi:hypothetical protein